MSKKSPGGRPSKLSLDLQNKLVALIQRGHYATTACAAVGLGEATYFRWMDLGDDHLETKRGRRVLVRARSPYREFREAVEKAKAQAQMLHMEAIRDAAFKVVPTGDGQQQRVEVKNWFASAWYLERTAPQLFARREVIHAGEGASPAKSPEEPVRKVVRFGGRYIPDGTLQTSAKQPDGK